MTMPITLKDITIHPVIEQQGPFFDAMGFFPAMTKELLDENRSWLQPAFLDPADKLLLCIQSFVIKTPHHNILVDACVGNHKPRPTRPFWHMMNSDRFEKGLAALGLTVNDIDYVMCTHLHTDHVGWNTNSKTAAGCRHSPRRNTSWPTASSNIGRRGRRPIPTACRGSPTRCCRSSPPSARRWSKAISSSTSRCSSFRRPATPSIISRCWSAAPAPTR